MHMFSNIFLNPIPSVEVRYSYHAETACLLLLCHLGANVQSLGQDLSRASESHPNSFQPRNLDSHTIVWSGSAKINIKNRKPNFWEIIFSKKVVYMGKKENIGEFYDFN
jgi:hypothetical protein